MGEQVDFPSKATNVYDSRLVEATCGRQENYDNYLTRTAIVLVTPSAGTGDALHIDDGTCRLQTQGSLARLVIRVVISRARPDCRGQANLFFYS